MGDFNLGPCCVSQPITNKEVVTIQLDHAEMLA
jgi:hypothetical protein